jgi:hypothetical protein
MSDGEMVCGMHPALAETTTPDAIQFNPCQNRQHPVYNLTGYCKKLLKRASLQTKFPATAQ